ncbi:MAG TPA: hypothetical protein VLW65_22040 [Bryobacteraceae bacterium]|nr:hypothetical protein [Bryobacteraceae bacterium]
MVSRSVPLFGLSLLVFASLTSIRPAYAQASTETPAQAAAAKAAAAEAAAKQAATEATAKQAAARQAAMDAAKTPAGPARTAAEATAKQAAAEATAAQVAARQAFVQAATARQQANAALLAERRAAAQQAAAERQAQIAAARQAQAAQAAARKAAPQPAAAGPAPAVAKTPAAAAAQTAAPVAAPATVSQKAVAGKTSAAPGSKPAANGAPNSTVTQISDTVTSVFGKPNTAAVNSKGGAAAGAAAPGRGSPSANALLPKTNPAANTPPAAANTPPAAPARSSADLLPSGAFGVGQSGDTILTVYGCAKHATQILCTTTISNQSKSDTQLHSSLAWGDAFIVDDQGNKHQRSMGYFLNADGEPRLDMDVPYGQSTKYVLVFNNISGQASKVALHSDSSGLDVEEIPVTDSSSAPAASSKK